MIVAPTMISPEPRAQSPEARGQRATAIVPYERTDAWLTEFSETTSLFFLRDRNGSWPEGTAEGRKREQVTHS